MFVGAVKYAREKIDRFLETPISLSLISVFQSLKQAHINVNLYRTSQPGTNLLTNATLPFRIHG